MFRSGYRRCKQRFDLCCIRRSKPVFCGQILVRPVSCILAEAKIFELCKELLAEFGGGVQSQYRTCSRRLGVCPPGVASFPLERGGEQHSTRRRHLRSLARHSLACGSLQIRRVDIIVAGNPDQGK